MSYPTIYFAAGLFNSPDLDYNLNLTRGLERRSFNVLLPQRDGFEFSKLGGALKKVMNNSSSEEIENATNQIIYLLDKGWFIGEKANLVLARLDEPIDEGVVDEISFARMCGIPVVGYRTDVRSPYGSSGNEVGGAHFFPPYLCDCFVLARGISQKILLNKLVGELRKFASIEKERASHPYSDNLGKLARQMFAGIKNLHSSAGLNEIAQRYNRMESSLLIFPRIVK